MLVKGCWCLFLGEHNYCVLSLQTDLYYIGLYFYFLSCSLLFLFPPPKAASTNPHLGRMGILYLLCVEGGKLVGVSDTGVWEPAPAEMFPSLRLGFHCTWSTYPPVDCILEYNSPLDLWGIWETAKCVYIFFSTKKCEFLHSQMDYLLTIVILKFRCSALLLAYQEYFLTN